MTWPKHLITDTSNAILINAHFDSIPSSSGAADDGVGVAVMLEMIRALSHNDKPLEYPIIFLFNGAEEWNHQGAHGFITQHKWSQQVKYLMNLEATGTGGRELVFQCNSGELAYIYGNSAPYPQASVMAHELFKAILHQVASTDWAFIIKFGPKGIRGIDTAYVDNGYVYHTSFDDEKTVPDATLYNTGVNLLHVTRTLADKKQLEKYAYNTNNAPEDENAVFFDLFFFKLILYSGSTVYYVHSLLILYGISVVYYLMRQSRGRITSSILFNGIRDELLVQGGITVIAALYGLFLTAFLPMRWYDGGMFIALVEFLPFTIFVTVWVRGWMTDRSKAYSNPILRQLSILSFWIFSASVCLVLGIMSGFIPCLWIFFISTASLVYWFVKKAEVESYRSERGGGRSSNALKRDSKKDDEDDHDNNKGKKGSTDDDLDLCFTNEGINWSSQSEGISSYLMSAEFWYLLILSPKILLTHRYYDATLTMLIPLFGKTGSAVPSDLAMAATIAFFVTSASAAVLANDLKTRLTKRSVYIGQGIVLLTLFYLLWNTSAYSDQRPKRLWIQHVHREYRNIPLSDRKHYTSLLSATTSSPSSSKSHDVSDYGLWVIAFDSQGFNPIQKYINQFLHLHHPQENNHEGGKNFQKVSCDVSNGDCYMQFPWYFPVADALRDSYYLATNEPPQIPKDQQFHLYVSSHPLTTTKTRLIEIVLIGPSHIHLVLRNSPQSGKTTTKTIKDRLVRWHLNESLPSTTEPIDEVIRQYEEANNRNKKKPVYTPNQLEGIIKRLEKESISPLRSENIFFFEIGFGLCPKHYCMKRLYVEVQGDDPIDVVTYGHYVEETRLQGKRVKKNESVEGGGEEDESVNDAIDSFVDVLPTWSKGAEWTKFPSYLVVERI